jgi:transposase
MIFMRPWRLLERQDAIQKKLAARHLQKGGLALYDLSSSYFEGTTCPLAKLGHNRDGKKGLLQVNYGLLNRSARLSSGNSSL